MASALSSAPTSMSVSSAGPESWLLVVLVAACRMLQTHAGNRTGPLLPAQTSLRGDSSFFVPRTV